MDIFLLIALFIAVIVGIPILIGLLIYLIPKLLGYPKTAKYITMAYGLAVLILVLLTIFEDQLFTNRNAKELVEEQNIKLNDEFILLNNKSTSAIGDYYHTFTLEISDRDKKEAIFTIKNSDNFSSNSDTIDTALYMQIDNRYFGDRITQNYETEDAYVREYFEPSGKEGYAPTFRRISISKTNNELTFEDIDE